MGDLKRTVRADGTPMWSVTGAAWVAETPIVKSLEAAYQLGLKDARAEAVALLGTLAQESLERQDRYQEPQSRIAALTDARNRMALEHQPKEGA